jgi:hypothetical protein
MNYRLATILAQEDASTAATKTIDLDVVSPISRLHIVYKPTNVSPVTALTGHPALCLTKVEIVDGSDVIFSASGMELRAAAFYGSRKPFADVLDFNSGSECMFEAPIYFGRKLYDPDLALDPTHFKNLQLKISHNKALGGSAPSSANLAVFADLYDDKPISPRGFLMTKELYTYLPTASAHHYVDLPTDHPYRMIMFGGISSGKMPMWRVTKVKLSEDFDKKIPLETTDTLALLQGLVDMYPRIQEHLIIIAFSAGVRVPITPGYEGFATGSGYGNHQHTISFGNGGGGDIPAYTAAAEGEAHWVHVGGWCPHNFVLLPTGDIDDIEDFYEVAGIKSLKLDLLADSSPGTSDAIQVVGQQFRSY